MSSTTWTTPLDRILSPVRLPVLPLQQQWLPGGTLASGSRGVKVASKF